MKKILTVIQVVIGSLIILLGVFAIAASIGVLVSSGLFFNIFVEGMGPTTFKLCILAVVILSITVISTLIAGFKYKKDIFNKGNVLKMVKNLMIVLVTILGAGAIVLVFGNFVISGTVSYGGYFVLPVCVAMLLSGVGLLRVTKDK